MADKSDVIGLVILELDAEIDRACRENATVVISRETARHARAFLVEVERELKRFKRNDAPRPLSELVREHDDLKDRTRSEAAAREARGELVFRDDIERRFWGEAYAAWLPLMTSNLDAVKAADYAVRELRNRV